MGELSTTVMLYSARWKTITVAIMEYLSVGHIGPAYALGAILIVLVLAAILAREPDHGAHACRRCSGWSSGAAAGEGG